MSQVIPRCVGEEATNPLGRFTKMLHQSLAARSLLLDPPNDYLCRRLKISQLLSLLITISHQVLDLLHIPDQLLVIVSFDLGQLLHSICSAIHNIGQVGQQFILFQQQAFKLCQSKANMSTKDKIYSKTTGTKGGNKYLSSPWQGSSPSLAAWRPSLEEQNYPAPESRLGPPED